VISRIEMPPSRIRLDRLHRFVGGLARTTGMIPSVRIVSKNFTLLTSTIHPCGSALHYALYFCERRHRRIARRRHCQRTMRRAAFDCPLRPATRNRP
jgi:hypothetical protein